MFKPYGLVFSIGFFSSELCCKDIFHHWKYKSKIIKFFLLWSFFVIDQVAHQAVTTSTTIHLSIINSVYEFSKIDPLYPTGLLFCLKFPVPPATHLRIALQQNKGIFKNDLFNLFIAANRQSFNGSKSFAFSRKCQSFLSYSNTNSSGFLNILNWRYLIHLLTHEKNCNDLFARLALSFLSRKSSQFCLQKSWRNSHEECCLFRKTTDKWLGIYSYFSSRFRLSSRTTYSNMTGPFHKWFYFHHRSR